METPILEQLERLRTAALDLNVPLETVQEQLLGLIHWVKNRMDLPTFSNFLKLVSERAALEARVERRRMERAALFSALVALETEESWTRN